MHVLHIKPFFLPFDIQHNQCPCRFFNSRGDTSSVVTKLRHRYCVCVLHMKPFFLPVDIQHNQCSCRFFNSRRDTSYVVTNLRHRYGVCVLHMKPFFLPVDIQQNQCPCRFSNSRRDRSSLVTELRHRDTTLPLVQYALQWAMQSHAIILSIDTTGTTYNIYEIVLAVISTHASPHSIVENDGQFSASWLVRQSV